MPGISVNGINLLVLIFIGYFSVVSSDADILLGNHNHHHTPHLLPGPGSREEIHKDVPWSRIDSLWEDVVKAAFASPMEWIQLRRALDKLTSEDYGWRPEEHLQPLLHHLTHPDRKFTYHKIYQATLGKSPRDKMGATAIAAMSVSTATTENDDEHQRNHNPLVLHETKNTKNNNNNNPNPQPVHPDISVKTERSSPLRVRPRLQADAELIQSLWKDKNVVESGKDFHWRPWIHQSSEMSGENVGPYSHKHEDRLELEEHDHLKFQQPKTLRREDEEENRNSEVEKEERHHRPRKHRKRHHDFEDVRARIGIGFL